MAAEVFDWLLRSAFALAVAAALVLALRPLFHRWLGAAAVLWLYLLLPAALLATSLPAPVVVSEQAVLPALAPDAVPLAVAPASFAPVARAPWSGALTAGLAAWATGALALAGWMLVQQRRFRRRLGVLRRREGVVWQADRDDIGPVVVGLLRPRIVLPADFERRYDPQQRELVLAHERVHLRRGDLPVNALACALRCVFWFNPLMHLAAARLRMDQELACDAAVLARHPHAGRAYATALLNTQLADLGLPLGCAWQPGHPLAWRITMIGKPLPNPSRLAFGATLALLASTATATTLWQQQPATVVFLPAIAASLAPAPLPGLSVDVALPAPSRQAAPARVVLADTAGARAPLPSAPVPRFKPDPRRQPLPAPPAPREVVPAAAVPAVTSAPRAGDGYQPPKVVRAKPAKIPTLERDPRIRQIDDGLVVRVDIDASGKPVAVAVHASALGPVYERNAIAAVKRWRFEPARRDGVAEPATVLLPVPFGSTLPVADAFNGEAVAHPRPSFSPPQEYVRQLQPQVPVQP